MNTETITNQLDDIATGNAQEVIQNIDITNLSFSDIYHDILNSLLNTITFPKDLTISIVIIILITALMQSFSNLTKHQKIFEMVCILLCINTIITPLSDLITSLQDTINTNGLFITSFTPIFTSILTITGKVTTSASYGAITYISCEIWIQFADKIILPFMEICLGLCCVNSLSDISLGEIINLIKKYIHWIMSVIMFLFSGLLSLQSAITNMSDRVSSKALKFVVSNGVPIVGNAVSDIAENVRASMLLIKSGVGFIGIIILLVNVLPPIINVLLMRISITLCETLADIFGITCIKKLLNDISSILSIIFSCVLCFALTFIISIGAMVLLVNE